MKLNQVLSESGFMDHRFMTDEKEINKFIREYRKMSKTWNNGKSDVVFPKYEINEDGSINVPKGTVKITRRFLEDGRFPIKFKFVESMILSVSGLRSFIGMPDEVGTKRSTGPAIILRSNSISSEPCHTTSFEGFTPVLNNGLQINDNCISLGGIHQYVNKIREVVMIPHEYVGPLLGLMMIDGVREVKTNYFWAGSTIKQALWIINQYLREGKDVISCKRELISAGLQDYAKL